MRLLASPAAPAMPPTMSTMASTRQNVSLRRMRRLSTSRSASSDMVRSLHFLSRRREVHQSFVGFFLVPIFLALALERGAQNVAQRRARVGRAVLRDRFLLLGDFERLDGDGNALAPAVELGDAGVDLLADGEAVGPLFGTVARQFRTLDEGGEVGADDLHVDAAFFHLDDFAGDNRALLKLAGGGLRRSRSAIRELLDAERDALLLDVDVENLRLDLVALLVLLDDLLARTFPVEIGQVHHAVDVTVEAEEQAEFGLVLDLAFDHRTGGILFDKHLPRIAHGLFETERDAALDRIDLKDLHLNFLRRRDDLAGMHVLLGPRHFGNVDQPFDAGLEFDEGAVIGDVGDAALEPRADRIFCLDALPRIVEQLLHAERNAVGLVIDFYNLHLHLLADIEHLGRMIDAPPGDIGDVQEAVDAAQIDEGAVVGDILDHAVDDLALFEILHQLLALLGAGLFQHGAARHDNVAAAAIHFQDLERLLVVHQRRHVADRPDVDLRARQEGHGAVEIDGEAALDLIEDDALDLFVVLERLLELAPAFLAARLVARQHGLAKGIFDAFEIDLDGVPVLYLVIAPGA